MGDLLTNTDLKVVVYNGQLDLIVDTLGMLLIALNHYCLRVPQEIVVWIFDTFDNNFEIKKKFTIYLKESCW